MENDANSKEYFDGLAPQWDDLRRNYFPESVREKALDTAGVRPGATAADIGAGTGFITEALLARGLKVIAVDQSPAMLDTLRAKFAGRGEVECRVGEAGHLPLPDQGVDYVFANMFLHHVESPAGTLRDMARALKHGGRLVITDLDQHHFEFLRTELHDRWLGFRRDDLKTWLADAGLQDVSVEGVGEDCSAASVTATATGGEQAVVSILIASGTK